MENHFALQHQLQEFLYENQLGAACIAKNDNCVPRRLRDQPKKNEKNLKEYWTQLTLRMKRNNESSIPNWISHFFLPLFSQKPLLFP